MADSTGRAGPPDPVAHRAGLRGDGRVQRRPADKRHVDAGPPGTHPGRLARRLVAVVHVAVRAGWRRPRYRLEPGFSPDPRDLRGACGVARRVARRLLRRGSAGEAAGYAWQPTGGGNSVAVCGLAGVVVLALCRRRHGMPFFSAPAVLLWCGALLATWHLPLLAVGIAAAAVTPQLIRAKSRWLSVIVLVVAAGTAVTLISVRNIHGAALMAGLLLAIPLTWRRVSSRDSVAA